MRYEHKNNQLQETEQLASMYTENSSSDILIIAVFWKKRKKKKKKKKKTEKKSWYELVFTKNA